MAVVHAFRPYLLLDKLISLQRNDAPGYATRTAFPHSQIQVKKDNKRTRLAVSYLYVYPDYIRLTANPNTAAKIICIGSAGYNYHP